MNGARTITGRHVLIAFLGFFFVVFAVNGVFVFFALKSWPGLATTDAYRKGVEYNQTLRAADRQAALGWRAVVVYGDDGVLSARFRDRTGAALSGLTVEAAISRPAIAARDRRITLAAAAPGVYRAPLALPLEGRWQVAIEARRGDDRFRITQEIWRK
jgi:nitrogen fixation protein FixH